MEHFGLRLELLLRMRGMTQHELAAQAGISQAAVSQYVCGKRLPTIAILCSIAKVLQVSPASLLWDAVQETQDVEAAAAVIISNPSVLSREKRNELVIALLNAC